VRPGERGPGRRQRGSPWSASHPRQRRRTRNRAAIPRPMSGFVQPKHRSNSDGIELVLAYEFNVRNAMRDSGRWSPHSRAIEIRRSWRAPLRLARRRRSSPNRLTPSAAAAPAVGVHRDKHNLPRASRLNNGRA
jgi:hypothetical protein